MRVNAWLTLQYLLVEARKPKEAQYEITKIYKKPAEYCFTQGLFVEEDGSFVESCGTYGKSYIRKYKLVDDDVPAIDRRVNISKDIFLEGIAPLGQTIWALTYREKRVLRLDRDTWEEQDMLPWKRKEGWGLATDGCIFFANIGGSTIYHLDANGVELKKVTVRRNGTPVRMLNDMIYVAPKLWINIWLTDDLLRVDPHTGVVEKHLSLKKLGVSWDAYTDSAPNTPNGVTYDARLDLHALFVTGKIWSDMFKISLSTADLCGEAAESTSVCDAAPRSPCWDGSSGSGTQMYLCAAVLVVGALGVWRAVAGKKRRKRR